MKLANVCDGDDARCVVGVPLGVVAAAAGPALLLLVVWMGVEGAASVGVPASSLLGLWLRSRFEEKDSPRRRRADGEDSGSPEGDVGGDDDEDGRKGDCWAVSLKMWIVSVALETERSEEVALKDIQ